jgi:hypothetical protein
MRSLAKANQRNYQEFFEALIPMPQARASHKLVWRIYLDEMLWQS